MIATTRKLIVQENQVGYTGAFLKPALSLWADGGRIFEGMLTAFSPYGVGLNDIRVDTINQSPAGQIISVKLGVLGAYAFRFHQIEWQADNLLEEELTAFPEVLKRGDDWLHATVNDLVFKTHVLTYSSHSRLSDGDSKDFLIRFPERDIPGIGKSLGGGVFYHWEVEELEGRLHLAIDHSRIIPAGLFMQVSLEISKDRLDYVQAAATGRRKLEDALAQIGLEFDR